MLPQRGGAALGGMIMAAKKGVQAVAGRSKAQAGGRGGQGDAACVLDALEGSGYSVVGCVDERSRPGTSCTEASGPRPWICWRKF